MITFRKTYFKQGLVVLTFALFSCQSDDKQSGATAHEVEMKVQTVEVVRPMQRSFSAEVLITGTARPNQKVMIYAMESGFVQAMQKDIGDLVRKGEVIAMLVNPELLRAYEMKKAQLNAKQSVYERLKSVQAQTPALTPIQMVEEAEADYLSAKAEWNAIQDRLNFLNVKAPFTGKITQRLIDEGALVQSGLTQSSPQGIAELQEVSPIR